MSRQGQENLIYKIILVTLHSEENLLLYTRIGLTSRLVLVYGNIYLNSSRRVVSKIPD